MIPNPPIEALEGEIKGCFRPPSAGYGLRIAHGFWIVAGLGVGPDCRITDYSKTWEDLYQARLRWRHASRGVAGVSVGIIRAALNAR
eukprot:6304496-Alexandrium_andersonii.AAC.1